MYCRYCGKELVKDSKFCHECGKEACGACCKVKETLDSITEAVEPVFKTLEQEGKKIVKEVGKNFTKK